MTIFLINHERFTTAQHFSSIYIYIYIYFWNNALLFTGFHAKESYLINTTGEFWEIAPALLLLHKLVTLLQLEINHLLV